MQIRNSQTVEELEIDASLLAGRDAPQGIEKLEGAIRQVFMEVGDTV